jgi:hypothetical protein
LDGRKVYYIEGHTVGVSAILPCPPPVRTKAEGMGSIGVEERKTHVTSFLFSKFVKKRLGMGEGKFGANQERNMGLTH